MEDLLVRERAAEQHVLNLLKKPDEPILSVPPAFINYRQVCQAAIFADYENVERHEAHLWLAHTEGKKYFHRALSLLRKKGNDRPVETRQVTKLYLEFIKQSQRFYREYVYKLNQASGGIVELESIAQQVKGDAECETAPIYLGSQFRTKILESCHQSLIYLGDLSRYRASEKLDKTPDFGPAIGYYALAASLQPSSGQGHHQQAVVALEQRQHLRAIYHLYRAITVANPHPNAAQNLRLEFEKTNAAWDKGELIQKRPPNDPESSKYALIGWFVRFHSMCFKGEPFRGHEELERETLSQLANEVKQRPSDASLMRMVLVNIAAQHFAGEKFQASPTEQHQFSFLGLFRFNVHTFSTLLTVFYDGLVSRTLGLEDNEVDMSEKLTPVLRSILPYVRLYTNWLLSMIHMFVGLESDEFLHSSIESFWSCYAKTIDLIAQVFPIWDLEEIEVDYLLEEDVETLEFQPLMNEATLKTWYERPGSALKQRFSDRNIVRATADDEALKRVNDFLADGLHLANNNDMAPIKLLGTRIFHGDESSIEPPVVRPKEYKQEPVAPPEQLEQKRKPISYAAAAANGNIKKPQQPVPRTENQTRVPAKNPSRADELSRMVDDLLEEDDGNNPTTPPQPLASHPAVVANVDMSYTLTDSAHDIVHVPDSAPQSKEHAAENMPSRKSLLMTPPAVRSSPGTGMSSTHHRLQSVSSLWHQPSPMNSPSFPSGLPVGTLGSPDAAKGERGHSRGNSMHSIHSRISPPMADFATPVHSGNRTLSDSIPHAMYDKDYTSLDQPNMGSPLLFGAGGSLWSTGLQHNTFKSVSPSNGQGG